MNRTRLSEKQLMRILHEADALGKAREVCRQPNVSEPPLYRWRQQRGGMEVSEAKRLRAPARDNAALQWLGGRPHAGQPDAQGCPENNVGRLAAKRRAAATLTSSPPAVPGTTDRTSVVTACCALAVWTGRC